MLFGIHNNTSSTLLEGIMLTTKKGRSIWIILLLLCHGAAADEEINADVSGWVAGEATSWLTQQDALRPSAVFSTLTPGNHQFRIHAYQNERFSREGSLYIELAIRDGDIHASQIHYYPFTPLYPRFSFGPDHGTGQLTLHSLEVETHTARITASFAGQLHYHQSSNTRPISQRTRPLRINIDLTAMRD
jgi:hypothetical protein